MKTWIYQYRCRRCGTYFDGPAAAGNDAEGAVLASARGDERDNLAPAITTHWCSPSIIGVAELVGALNVK